MSRFLIVQEPTSLWAVFDAFSGVPAEIAGNVQIGLTKDEAERSVKALNRCEIYFPKAGGATLLTIWGEKISD